MDVVHTHSHTPYILYTPRSPGERWSPSLRGWRKADTTEHRAHKGTLDPTPRWDKLTWQEVPGKRQAPGAGIPRQAPLNHKNTPHHYHCNESPGRNIIQLSSTIVTQQIQMA
ncbi:hypothetical protein ILYODFUR_023193 [Ilyodon furcidens]|uniref:Uncharacterized protein n=1 Tax=Ilyodon furcidens TaxID=33524 RepID=A0ABV0V8C5_9TELE